MSDLDSRRVAHGVRTHQADPRRSTRYADALNRYLGAAGSAAVRTAGRPAPKPGPVAARTGIVRVGADETPSSFTAVDHAAIEAELRGWPLRILHVQQGRALGSSRDAGARLLRQLTDRVHAGSPSVPVNSRLAVGSPTSLLLAEARAADLLVVGNRHGPAGTALGLSVADQLAGHHEGVLLVVRVPGHQAGPAFGDRPVVVGVGQPGEMTSAAALALQEAGLRGCDLVMLNARRDLAPAHRTEVIDGVSTHHRTVAADPITALTDASRRAAALVIGRHGLDGHAATTVGSMSRAMIQHAQCPVFLV